MTQKNTACTAYSNCEDQITQANITGAGEHLAKRKKFNHRILFDLESIDRQERALSILSC